MDVLASLARIVLAAALLLTAAPALAQEHDEEAHGLFAAGAAAFESGRYEEALEYFQHAYALSPRPALLYNLGQAADRARRDDVALDAFRRYLDATPDAPNRAEIEGRVRVLERAVAEHTSAEPPTAGTPTEGAHDMTDTAPPISPTPPPAVALDPVALALTIVGGVFVIGGAVMLGVGVPDLAPPNPDLILEDELKRQQRGEILAGVGGAALGIGLIGAIIGVIMIVTASSTPRASAFRLAPGGLALSF